MSAALETLADQLICGDHLRRGFRVFAVEAVAVTHDGPVRLTVRRVNGTDKQPAAEGLILPPGEIIQRVEA